MSQVKVRTALISVYHKDNLEPLIECLTSHGVQLYSTGGTQKFLEGLGAPVTSVEDITSYPAIFGGRVKTLHPAVFGGILYRRDTQSDVKTAEEYNIPAIDMVVVDLYPFEATVAAGAAEEEVIEKIDIGGISLIRAAAKNYKDVLVISSQEQYQEVGNLMAKNNGHTELADRRLFAAKAFDITSHYDTAIFNHFNKEAGMATFKQSIRQSQSLRYGENPHQRGQYYGDLSDILDQLHGKALSYNNLTDIDAAVALIEEFGDTAFAILKHTNACGVATGKSVKEAYTKALQADTVSAFGGVLITNKTVDQPAAQAITSLFFEVLIAPDFEAEALEILKEKKNRILLRQKEKLPTTGQFKSLLNGVIRQDRDLKTEGTEDLKTVTKKSPSDEEEKAMVFAGKLVKHTKSNAIVLARDGQMLSSGVGQTSRVDALKQAIAKAKAFGFDLNGAVMASDAFFPFPDCVEIARAEGIKTVIQPGGSVKDQDSIAFCDKNDMAMVFTGVRHFKH